MGAKCVAIFRDFGRYLLNIRQSGVAVAIAVAALVTTVSCDPAPNGPDNPGCSGAKQDSIYDFSMKNIDGKDVPLSKFRARFRRVVNVASKCGNTPQYAGLESLYKEKKSQGFAVLGFPANQFGAQEPEKRTPRSRSSVRRPTK